MTSATWNSVVTTDQDGVYDIVGLPPDNYTLHLLDPPPNQIVEDRRVRKEDMAKLLRLALDIHTEWDGSIEGTVRDVAGEPAHVLIELRHPDGTPGTTEGSMTDTKKGHYRFSKLPVGGRFMLVINSFGPDKGSPYASFYYPSAADSEHAEFVEITPESQHIQNLDFTLPPLQERQLRVRALDSAGQPISGAYILVAYEHTKAWDDLNASNSGTTDQNGIADIPVFGDFRIRVYADRFLSDWSLRYSEAVELNTTKLPQNLNLVLSSTQVHLAR